jgi:hypothetical protein
MSNKTISINPSLFSLNGSKSKKNREKKQKPEINPLISPNVLKNKLLKRIKEHKQRETANLENNKNKLSSEINKSDSTFEVKEMNELNKFTDEFSDSINYLQTLSKQKKVNDEKINYDKQKQHRKEELERKTLKNYDIVNQENQPYINLELPEELKTTSQLFIPTEPNYSIKPYVRDSIPYGILKGGNKPTYRDWTKTQRNNLVTNPNAALIIDGYQSNKVKNERESRLNNLREKLKFKQIENSRISMKPEENLMMTQNFIQKPNLSKNSIPSTSISISNYESEPLSQALSYPIVKNTNEEFSNVLKPEDKEKIIAIKKITKKTIKRKYTLGKSKMERKVGVLVKDRGTRKKILSAQKELKRKPINDIKSYLRDHNLIKVGSNAPNDVIRKLYESAMLAGEITNSNSETLLYNFSKEDKQL